MAFVTLWEREINQSTSCGVNIVKVLREMKGKSTSDHVLGAIGFSDKLICFCLDRYRRHFSVCMKHNSYEKIL